MVVVVYSRCLVGVLIWRSINWSGRSRELSSPTLVYLFSPVFEQLGSEYFSQCRLLSESDWDWIYMAPVLLVLSFNIVFLIRIMWVSTKGRRCLR